MRTIDQILGTVDTLPGNGEKWEMRSVDLRERDPNDIFLVGHHSVSQTLQRIEAEFKSPNRTVSANGGSGPREPGVDEYLWKQYVPWRWGRAYTTASNIDDKAITFEMADLVLAYPWPIGGTGLYAFAELAAAMHVELGMPLDEWHVLDHLTVYERGWGSYPTQCAGDFMRARIRDYVLPTARQIVADNQKEPEMTIKTATFTDNRDRTVKAGTEQLVYTNSVDTSTAFAQTIEGKPTAVGATLDLVLVGEPGSEVETQTERYRLVNGAVKDIVKQTVVTHVIPADGTLYAQHAINRGVTDDWRLRWRVRAKASDVKVTKTEITRSLFA